MQQAWTDKHLWTSDDLRLHYRDYGKGQAGRPTILCLPGLTRNARDFESLALRLSPRFRVVCLSLRGRGESDYSRDPLTYIPLTYLQDVGRLFDEAEIESCVIVGTSLGGLIGLLLDVTQKSRIKGLVLNDLGPEIGAEGMARIRAQVGKGGNWPSWLHAARDIARRQADIYPGWTLEKWLLHAKRLCRVSREGRIVWDYDPEIAAPFSLPNGDGAAAIDLWLALDSYLDRPVLSIRGDRSDILTAETQARMKERLPKLRAVTVPRVGHAPTLEEPVALEAIETFLGDFA